MAISGNNLFQTLLPLSSLRSLRIQPRGLIHLPLLTDSLLHHWTSRQPNDFVHTLHLYNCTTEISTEGILEFLQVQIDINCEIASKCLGVASEYKGRLRFRTNPSRSAKRGSFDAVAAELWKLDECEGRLEIQTNRDQDSNQGYCIQSSLHRTSCVSVKVEISLAIILHRFLLCVKIVSTNLQLF